MDRYCVQSITSCEDKITQYTTLNYKDCLIFTLRSHAQNLQVENRFLVRTQHQQASKQYAYTYIRPPKGYLPSLRVRVVYEEVTVTWPNIFLKKKLKT